MSKPESTPDRSGHAGLALPLRGRSPQVHPEAWLAPFSVVSGDVTIGARSSVWYGVSVRADHTSITLGEGVNLQDNVVVHADPGSPVTVADDVSVGHGAVLHGCTVGSGTVVGMGAVVMNGASIGRECLIAGGAVVLENTEIPDGSLVAGVPAKVRRPLTEEERAGMMTGITRYVSLAEQHRSALED